MSELLAQQALKHRPAMVSISDPAKAQTLQEILGMSTEVVSGPEGLIRLATLPRADIVLIAIVGTAGLQPALAAIRAGKDIAIASKEILVMAGEIVMAKPANMACASWLWTASIRPFSSAWTANRPAPSAGFG